MNHIEAMAIVNPNLCKSKTIQVEVEQTNKGPIPHMHVYHDKTRNRQKCSYVRLDKAEYSTHHREGLPLPRNLKKEFIEVMSSPWPKHVVDDVTGQRTATGYEAAVGIWVETFEGNDMSKFSLDTSGSLICPDYSKL